MRLTHDIGRGGPVVGRPGFHFLSYQTNVEPHPTAVDNTIW